MIKLTFTEIYKKTIDFWQTEIDISDGKQVEPPNWGQFDNLSKTWNLTEDKTKSESELIKLMVWGIFCAYHKKAIENFQNGITKVLLTELDIEYTKYKFEESLFDTQSDYYAELRKEYITE